MTHAQNTIGIVGLGLVGSALAQRFLSAGWHVTGFDLSEQAREDLSALGGQAASTVAAVAEAASCVVLAVFNTDDVLSVVEGAQGLLSVPGVRHIIDCSTGEPQALEALASRLRGRGVGFIEAPLSGSSQQIAAGTATLLLGGESEAIMQCAPVLSAMSEHQVHVGSAGMGARAKLATNLVLGLNRAVLAEGMVFAEQLGITPEKFLALVLASPATSGAAQAKGRMMVSGDFTPQSRIRQHLKDVDLMLAQAAALGQKLPLSETHAALMRAAIAAGDGELDNAAIVRELRRQKT
ncbi:NAD(P)-dependent oxidoreductase [Hylemonella gracilis]|uniref:6-phosphogluconate dehydrogenase n=1 Tax=Hylemonella gracilis ATCC 19624 TaxID=887062 RepID=F3KT56_9BURK|nr:NAD(P)-dependent oxidoreductase [Hylemonella gracilis]EGI77052.1 6-phosphogluconate dehydrogenase [Hylemonella gracilis ATCC 19624]